MVGVGDLGGAALDVSVTFSVDCIGEPPFCFPALPLRGGQCLPAGRSGKNKNCHAGNRTYTAEERGKNAYAYKAYWWCTDRAVLLQNFYGAAQANYLQSSPKKGIIRPMRYSHRLLCRWASTWTGFRGLGPPKAAALFCFSTILYQTKGK